LDNSIDAIARDDGLISIFASKDICRAGRLQIQILDNGAGIDPHILPKLKKEKTRG